MTNYEFIKINQGLITYLAKEGITANDVDSIPMYEEYMDMKNQDLKIGYIVYTLAQKYNCSERHVYKVVKRLSKNQ